MASLAPDVIVVTAYGLILLPPEVLDLPRFGCINVHGSRVPRWRGAAPIAAAILAGDVEAGVSIMRMDAGVDCGPILERGESAHRRKRHDGHAHPEARQPGSRSPGTDTAALAGREITAIPQPEDGLTRAPRITKEDGQIDWAELGGADRAPRAVRGPALADGVLALEPVGVEGSPGAGGSGGVSQGGAGVREPGTVHCGKGGKCRGGDGNGRAVAGRGAVGRQARDADRRALQGVCVGLWGASCHHEVAPHGDRLILSSTCARLLLT